MCHQHIPSSFGASVSLPALGWGPWTPRLELSFMPLVLSLAGQCGTGGAAGKPRPPGPSGEYRVEPWGLPQGKSLLLHREPRHSVAHFLKVG